MHRVKIDNEIYLAEDATTLSEILIKNKKSVEHPCGGMGRCKKCVAINNSALLGTVKFATEKNDLSDFIRKAEYVDLSSDKYFSDLFIENLSW